MADPFLAEIRIFAGNFAPSGWAFCNGQILPLAQNAALFSLLGTTYGGNGQTNFALPDLQGRVPMQPGQGPGLSLRNLGESGGSATVALTESEMPAHSHALSATTAPADDDDPAGKLLATAAEGVHVYGPAQNLVAMGQTDGAAGGSQPHNNRQPYLALTFIIALEGVYPPRP